MTKSPSTISISNIFKFRHFNPPYLLNLLLRFQNIVVSIPFNYLQSAKSCIRIFQMISPSNITKHLHFPAFFRKILPWNIRNMPFFRWISPPFPHLFGGSKGLGWFLLPGQGGGGSGHQTGQWLTRSPGAAVGKTVGSSVEVGRTYFIWSCNLLMNPQIWWFWWFCDTKMM